MQTGSEPVRTHGTTHSDLVFDSVTTTSERSSTTEDADTATTRKEIDDTYLAAITADIPGCAQITELPVDHCPEKC